MGTKMRPTLRNLQLIIQGMGLETKSYDEISDSFPAQFRIETGPVVFKFTLSAEHWVVINIGFIPNGFEVGKLTLNEVQEVLKACGLIHEALLFQSELLHDYMNFGWEVSAFDKNERSGASSNVPELVKEKLFAVFGL